MKILQQISFEFGNATLLDNGIVRLEMFENATIGIDECRLLNNAIGELRNYQESLILMVPNYSTYFTTESRDFSASEEGLKYTIADAMISKNLAHKILISFYLKMNNPKKPSKAFSTEDEAIAWLLTFKK